VLGAELVVTAVRLTCASAIREPDFVMMRFVRTGPPIRLASRRDEERGFGNGITTLPEMAMSTRRRSPRPGGRSPQSENARERILHTAYDLFARNGIRAVGVDRIVAESGVAKTTLYRHFGSKDDLVVAALALREALWSRDWLEHEVELRGGPASERLLAVFDIFGDWFRADDYEGCLFMRTLLELGDRTAPPAAASVAALGRVRSWLVGLAEEAGVPDPARFAGQWQLLMLGSLVKAATGDVNAASEARQVASLLLERELPGRADAPESAVSGATQR
jgi:AcrR family transcriptional regulator